MKNINHTRSSISDDIRNILCSSANIRRAIPLILRFFFFNDTATTEIYTLSLHDALPIYAGQMALGVLITLAVGPFWWNHRAEPDRKSTRLNSSHSQISYAVFCLKKKKLYQYHEKYQPHQKQHQ